MSYGNRVGIRTNSPELMDRMLDLIPPGWEPVRSPFVDRLYSVFVPRGNGQSSKVRRLNLVYGDLDRIARTPVLDDALDLMESNLQIYTAALAKNRVFVHAGAVGWRGRAIVIPGRSFSGKSSLVVELVRAGASEQSFARAADLALESAQPLLHNGYKVSLAKALIRHKRSRFNNRALS